MSHESGEGTHFEDGIELTLKGTPEMVLAVTVRVAQELDFQGKRYAFDCDRQCSTATFIEGTIAVSPVAKEGWRAGPIAIIELYLLPEERTLFRLPPCRYWGILPEDLSNFDPHSSLLTHLLVTLFAEFQRLGFIDFREEKPPIGFRVPHREENG